jgi:hypothetical protein
MADTQRDKRKRVHNIQQKAQKDMYQLNRFCVLAALSVLEFGIILRVNSDYFPKQH